MHTLVRGGVGFIGSHLCNSLVQHNWEVTILDNLSAGSKDNISHLLRRTPKNSSSQP